MLAKAMVYFKANLYHDSHIHTHTHSEKVLGIKIRTFGFKGHFKKRSVIIMNHVSHFDWLFFWSVVDRHGDFSFWKVITKEKPLRQVPILGKFKSSSKLLRIQILV